MSLFKPIKDPVEGSMHVVGCTAIDAEFMAAPCHITYVIQADGVTPFSGDQTFEISTARWPQPGDDLPVIFDREKPDRVKIDWDRLPTHADSARMHADELAASLAAQPSAARPAVATAADPAASADADATIDRLERLAALHASGALTDAEFAAEKAKILSGGDAS